LTSSQQLAGARASAGTAAIENIGRSNGRPGSTSEPPIGTWAFTGVAVASFGGPLALAALNAPGLVGDASASAGLAMLAAVAVFTAPLAIWLRYSRLVSSSGGLYAFVEAAAGRRVALAQAALWIVSYVLYLVYTTVQIVDDILPSVVPSERGYQTLLALLIPIAIAGVMIAGRAATLIVIGLIAAAQLALAGILDAVTLAHISTPASTFEGHRGAVGGVVGTLKMSLLCANADELSANGDRVDDRVPDRQALHQVADASHHVRGVQRVPNNGVQASRRLRADPATAVSTRGRCWFRVEERPAPVRGDSPFAAS